MLNVVIGLIFIILLLSLFATTVMEILSGLFGLRGRNLKFALRKMLADTESYQAYDQFQESALYKQLSSKWMGKYYPPSYLSSSNFSQILLNVLDNMEGDKLQEKISKLEDERLRTVLSQFVRETGEKTAPFRTKVESWFDDVMDRASGWFKRYIQLYLIIVGFAIAVVFNADVIEIFGKLENDPNRRLEVYEAARNYVGERSQLLLENNSLRVDVNPSLVKSLHELDGLIANDIRTIQSPLGLGWTNVDTTNADVKFWLLKILGWLVMALAISLGAPFWFDLLRKLVNIRSSGNVPPQTTTVINQVPVSNEPGTERIEVKEVEDEP